MAPAACTLGKCSTRLTSSWKKALCCSGFAYVALGSDTCIVKTPSARKPGSTARSFTKLRRRRPEPARRSEEHTSELQSRLHIVCRLLLEKKKNNITTPPTAQPP